MERKQQLCQRNLLIKGGLSGRTGSSTRVSWNWLTRLVPIGSRSAKVMTTTHPGPPLVFWRRGDKSGKLKGIKRSSRCFHFGQIRCCRRCKRADSRCCSRPPSGRVHRPGRTRFDRSSADSIQQRDEASALARPALGLSEDYHWLRSHRETTLSIRKSRVQIQVWCQGCHWLENQSRTPVSRICSELQQGQVRLATLRRRDCICCNPAELKALSIARWEVE